MTGATPPPSPSGARLTGDDLQHLIAWYWCLKACSPGSGITSVGIEVDHVGNLDDVAIAYTDGRRRYIQVKAAVSSAGLVNAAWLATPASSSLIKRLYSSWDTLGRPDDGIALVTSRPIDPHDVLLRERDRHNRLGTRLRRSSSKDARHALALVAASVGCTVEEILDFLDVLEIQLGQTERDWRDKVDDAAVGAGVSTAPASLAVALTEMREWVKTTRGVRAADDLRTMIDRLGLRAGRPRTLVVVHAIDHVPVEGDDGITVDWVDRFRGDSPETRRGLTDPTEWHTRLPADLTIVREELRRRGVADVAVRGAMRLPAWFAVGAALRDVAGFDIAAYDRGNLWAATSQPMPTPQVQVLFDTSLNSNDAAGVAVVVEMSSIGRDEVAAAFATRDDLSRLVSLTIEGGPNRRLFTTGTDTLAAAVAVRDWIRRNLVGTPLHLVLVANGPFALFLGHVWDRVPPTTIYEDLAPGYEAAFTFTN
ncbi:MULTISPECIES: SAVED domain-containing protein [unclassified Rhodococcus (in: high G+C Gram-positive bacteria)]|uniref:SAVED domain-containing protein n=1 Tax=unclassified Rhodococcus (in: high G+C Gram-positive bacteria) TaxID=192944 RepID=UPI00114053F9|nr:MULTISPECIES: SAVED domain-containing protein [unclassified Rhodococcus (in: high G+C Gram-positive bacteria)]